MSEQNPILDRARQWLDAGRQVALATVVETWGSSPCPAGSQMVINDQADFAGSVSGGCIESAVVSESMAILAEGRPEVVEYGVTPEASFAAGLACGGNVKVYIETLDGRLWAVLADPRPQVRAIDLAAGTWTIVDDTTEGDLQTLAAAALAEDRAGRVEVQGRGVFLHPLVPPPRLIIIGAVRIAQALGPMAEAAGFAVTIIDPRAAFATAARFPGAVLVKKWPDEGLQNIGIDGRAAIVTLTHDAKHDDLALAHAVRSDAFYIGALGSRKTHEKRLARLRALELSAAELDRICAPVGLDIGARSPAEIAVAVLAQVIAAKNGRGDRR